MFISRKISLKKDSSDPVYMQLYRELAKQIRAHNPDKSAVFPSERTLCAELGMHRATVHRAYEEFVRTGVALRQQDRTLVLSRAARTKLEGYVPSIGILLPELFSLFIEKKERTGIQYIKGIFDHAARLNYAVSVIPLPPPETPAGEIENFIETRLAGLSGIIHLGTRCIKNDPVLAAIAGYTGVPQVCINSTMPAHSNVGAVCGDFRAAAEDLCAYMKKRNIRSCGLAADTVYSSFSGQNPEFRYFARERVALMHQYISDSGIRIPEMWNDVLFHSAEEFFAYIKHHSLPDAIWCCNDFFASKLLLWCSQAGIRVPEDLKIIGFDGLESDGALATIRQPFAAIGEMAVDTLLEHFECGINPGNRIRYVQSEFVPGRSL